MIDDLYSARILGLAANLPHAGRLTSPDGTGERVARLCGSRAIVDVTLDDQGRITDFAQDIKACALGQAAAGVIGEVAIGATADEITTAAAALTAMLKADGEGPEGRFEGLRVLKPVADYPQRHASTQVAMGALMDAVDMALATSLATRDIPEAERTRRAGAA
jgi:NifU-like protein involved in Fe-S cluster formation